MSSNVGGKAKQVKLLDRFTKKKPEFKPYRIDLAIDLHERLEKLAGDTGMSKDAVNDALNYAIRKLVSKLEREARS
jgi:uncharacterized protein YidB (DUF937 family)